MRAWHILIATILLAHTKAFALEPQQVVGKVDPPVPSGCKAIGGGIVVSREDGDIAFKELSCENEVVFWLQVQVGKWPSLKWKVADVLTIPRLLGGNAILTPVEGCHYENQAAWVIAIGRWKAAKIGGEATSIQNAWIIPLDPKEQRFKKVAPSEVWCAYFEDRD